MNKGLQLFIILFFVLGIVGMSCVSVDDSVKNNGNAAAEPTVTTAPSDTTKPEEKDVYKLSAMQEYLENGIDKINYGSISEGIEQLILVLAEKEAMTNPPEEAIELAKDAETRLNKLKSALFLEVEPEWLDSSLNQVKGDTLDIFPQPSVLLTYDGGIGRSLVANAPVAFRFIKGSGIMSGLVAKTNDHGQANVIVTRFDNPNEENIIEAYLYYKEKDFTYTFTTITRSFIYAPPSRQASIFVLERYPDGNFEDPDIFNAVYNNLKDVALDFTLSNAGLNEKAFLQIYNGDKSAITHLGLEDQISYICAVLNDCFHIEQYEYKGKKYNVFLSEARATIRIIRVADGKTVYTNSVECLHAQSEHGKGSSPELSARDVLKKSSVKMEALLSKEIDVIKKALTGKGE
ncbi:MAG: hypothetical protein JXJ04_27140 [Spirochaetales bacterium]|nr:hypothetical protein [Spirochaetales bacterium]